MKKLFAAVGVLAVSGLIVGGAIPAAAAPIEDWDFSQTRLTGHHELVPDGLHIWTEGATSTDKVAGYLAVDIPLASVDSSSVDYTATTGITPGSQLVVDIDADGIGDGILVGEAVYGENHWLSNSATAEFKALAPHTGGGNGSEWFGTLTEWGTAIPDATIVAVGFSLGSGVLGDGVVHAVTVGGVDYTFDAPTKAPSEEQVGPLNLAISCLNNLVTADYEVYTTTYTYNYETGEFDSERVLTNGWKVEREATTEECAPGTGPAFAIVLDPNVYETIDECGTENDKYRLVLGETGRTGQSNFLTFTVDDEQNVDPNTYTGYAQAGQSHNVFYKFEGVEPDLNGVYTIKTVIPRTTNVPCEVPPTEPPVTDTPAPPANTASGPSASNNIGTLAETGVDDGQTSLLAWIALIIIVAGTGILVSVKIVRSVRANRK